MPVVVGLTGGIGAGKSTVADQLGALGAVVIDADRIVREIQEPGGDAYAGIVERFGEDILCADGTIDRPALAAVAFADDESRAALNALTHPHVARIMSERMKGAADDAIVVMDIPLLAERGAKARDGFSAVIVVDATIEVALARLVTHRGFSEADARARIAAQVSRQERCAIADIVIDNTGSLADLTVQVEAAWIELERIRDEKAGSDTVH